MDSHRVWGTLNVKVHNEDKLNSYLLTLLTYLLIRRQPNLHRKQLTMFRALSIYIICRDSLIVSNCLCKI